MGWGTTIVTPPGHWAQPGVARGHPMAQTHQPTTGALSVLTQRWPSLGSRCWGRGPAILCCWPPSPWPQGCLVLLKQRACAFTHTNCTHCVVSWSIACGHAWKGLEGTERSTALSQGLGSFDLLPASGHLHCLLWAPASSVTSSQVCGSGAG